LISVVEIIIGFKLASRKKYSKFKLSRKTSELNKISISPDSRRRPHISTIYNFSHSAKQNCICEILMFANRTSWNRIPRFQIDVASQLWKEGSVRDAMPAEEGGAVKLMCQECGKE
jgi:hypothetical protein